MIQDLQNHQNKLHMRMEEMEAQLSRLTQQAAQPAYDAHVHHQAAPPIQQAPAFQNHYANGIAAPINQHTEVPRTLPPIVNGYNGAPMQDVQYSSDRR